MRSGKKIFKLRYKLVLFYLPFILIPILVLSLYLTIVVGRSSIEQSIQIYRQSTNQLRQNILNELDEYYSIGYDIARDTNIIEYLSETNKKDVYLYNFYAERIQTVISKARYRKPDIQLHIYTPNQNLKFSGLFIRNEALFKAKQTAVKDYMSSVFWEGVVQENVLENNTQVARKYLSLLIPIAEYKLSSEPIGVLEIHANLADFEHYLVNGEEEENVVLLTDERSQPIISNVTVTDELIKIAQMDLPENEKYVLYNGKQYLITIDTVESSKMGLSGWKLCNLIPLDYVYQNQRYIQQANLIICIACIILALPLLILFSHTITKRLEYLADRMNDIRHGEYAVSVTVPGNDEVAWLGRRFNHMLEELDLLTKQTVEAKLKEEQLDNAQKEAQLLALQRQINPHYLFNTMESIRMSLILKGDTQTAELIQIFAESYREMIDGTEKTISLNKEITFIRRYFIIQQFRFEGKIHLKIDISDELPNYRIPKFLLQPLIENAVYHGLELKEGEGSILLSIYSDVSYLHIDVSDDGIGMGEAELNELNASLGSNEETGKNTALRNIARRLRLMYGADATMMIQSEQDKGTRLFLSLPVRQLEVAPDVQSIDFRG
ncbi:MAG: histidine kinase [Clostridiaceae bacterium]|nr:histidine kinase [Clostridiaceae bacterium]